MKKTAVVLCALMLFLTGCHENNPLYEWKQDHDQKKFEAEMTAKAKDFIQWYIDIEKKISEENEDYDFDPEKNQLNFVRLGVDNKNYAVFTTFSYDNENEVENHSYVAIDINQWDPSMTFSPENPPENLTFFGDLTRTEDGMGFICSDDCYSEGPNTELHKGLIFEEATPTSKDLEKLAAFKESLKVNRASKAISSLYGLSEERSFQLSKTILSWKKVSNQRAMTKRDLDHLTVEFAGVKASEIVESFKDLAKGEEARFNNLIERAARVNEVSPEAVKTMIQDAFMR